MNPSNEIKVVQEQKQLRKDSNPHGTVQDIEFDHADKWSMYEPEWIPERKNREYEQNQKARQIPTPC